MCFLEDTLYVFGGLANKNNTISDEYITNMEQLDASKVLSGQTTKWKYVNLNIRMGRPLPGREMFLFLPIDEEYIIIMGGIASIRRGQCEYSLSRGCYRFTKSNALVENLNHEEKHESRSKVQITDRIGL